MDANADLAEYLARIVELGNARQYAAYMEFASTTLLVVETVHFLPKEVSLIWQAKWNAGKVLYLLSRYLPYTDATLALIYSTTAESIKSCLLTFSSGTVLTSIGVVFAEIIIFLRVYALSGRSKRIGCVLLVLFAGSHSASLAFLIKFLRSLEYEPSPVPTVVGCYQTKSSPTDLSILFYILVAGELAILAITSWIIVSRYRKSTHRLVTMFYRDGLAYFFGLSALSAGNLVCILVAPPGYAYLLSTAQRVLHSILATRMVLHIRDVHNATLRRRHSGDIPMSEIGSALQVHVHVESMQFPGGYSFGVASETGQEFDKKPRPISERGPDRFDQ